jgi:membrane-bound lytic murein transglycosylase D
MRNFCLKFILGLCLGTFFGTATNTAWATFAPSANNFIAPLKNQTFDRDQILDDYQSKISTDFKVTPDIRNRVAFWFDVYTKYSAQEEIIHHSDYPWVIFRVIDLRPILTAEDNKWVNYHKSVDYSKKQKQEVRNILYRLSKRKSFIKLDNDEQEIYDQLLKIPGKNIKKVIASTLRNLRTQVGQKDFIEKGIESSSLYISGLEKVFAEQKLPLELTRLPFVESSFNVGAVSKVGASGIWQVMPYIGKKFLVMNNAVDERNSPVKSAESAAFLLKQNKQILKNWPLALTAYNHGAGGLTKAVRQMHSRDLEFLIEHYRQGSFGFASQNFYASFLAVLHAEKYKEEIYDTIVPQSPLQFRELKLTQSVRLKKLLETTGVTKEDFQKYNLDIKKDAYRKNLILPKGYVVHIPSSIVSEFMVKKQKFAKLLDDDSVTLNL